MKYRILDNITKELIETVTLPDNEVPSNPFCPDPRALNRMHALVDLDPRAMVLDWDAEEGAYGQSELKARFDKWKQDLREGNHV